MRAQRSKLPRALMAIILASLVVLPCAQAETEAASAAVPVEAQATNDDGAATGRRDLQAAVASLRQQPVAQPEFNPWPMLKGLGLCLATLCGLVFILKKLNRVSSAGSGRRLKVLERLPIGQKSTLVLVEVDGVTRLIGIGAETITDLGVRQGMRPARIPPPKSKEPEFQDVLERTADIAEVRP